MDTTGFSSRGRSPARCWRWARCWSCSASDRSSPGASTGAPSSRWRGRKRNVYETRSSAGVRPARLAHSARGRGARAGAVPVAPDHDRGTLPAGRCRRPDGPSRRRRDGEGAEESGRRREQDGRRRGGRHAVRGDGPARRLHALLALSSISIIPEADKLFGRPPAFTVDQFAPIALISADPTILVVPADKPWKTPKDFIADAKRRPGQISFSSSGVYGTLHMAMELFAHAAGIKLRHVPYAGAGPALTAILGGHVDALASGPAVVLPHIKPGQLRPLAGRADKRVPALPDVPTFK